MVVQNWKTAEEVKYQEKQNNNKNPLNLIFKGALGLKQTKSQIGQET